MVWTILWVIILILIALPPLQILYIIDGINKLSLTIKPIGHLWYRSYKCTSYEDLSFASFLLPTWDLKPGELWIPEADHPVVLPVETTIWILISSEDVLNSQAVPFLDLKTDAIPINSTKQPWYPPYQAYAMDNVQKHVGQTSFIPIVFVLVPLKYFEKWSPSISPCISLYQNGCLLIVNNK